MEMVFRYKGLRYRGKNWRRIVWPVNQSWMRSEERSPSTIHRQRCERVARFARWMLDHPTSHAMKRRYRRYLGGDRSSRYTRADFVELVQGIQSTAEYRAALPVI